MADERGDHVRVLHEDQLERLGLPEQDRRHQTHTDVDGRMVQADERRPVVGCASCVVEPVERSRGELAVVDPLARRRRHERVQHQEPEVRGLEHLVQRAGATSASSSPRANASRTSWLPVPTSMGPGQRVEDGARLGVLLGQSVVGDVAGHEEYVGARVEREQVRHDRVGSRRGRRAARRSGCR